MHTHITFLLDETGSMRRVKDDTIGSFNSLVEEQEKVDGRVTMSLVSFNSNRTVTRQKRADVADIARLTDNTYSPEANTPLIDACVQTIQATDEAVGEIGPDQVVVVVLTDGKENASTEHTNTDLAEMVSERSDEWEFVFLGADMDAFATAQESGMDIDHKQTASFGQESMDAAMSTTARNVASYASGERSSTEYTDEQQSELEDTLDTDDTNVVSDGIDV